MIYKTKLETLPAGYALHDSTGLKGESVQVVYREFSCSDDGELFISRLEGFPTAILNKIAPSIQPSQVDHLFIVINKDLSCTVYVNEINTFVKIQTTRSVAAGEEVTNDDIADIDELKLDGINIPEDSAVVYLFSVQWRKGLFFDFEPISPNGTPRNYNLSRTLGSFYAFLSNRSVFSLNDAQWKILLESDWFPFASLPKDFVKNLIARTKDSGQLDILIPELVTAVHDRIPHMLERWVTIPDFAPHIELIKHATARFLDKDYVSCVAIVFPRIEGILRSVHSSLRLSEKPTQTNLAASVLQVVGNELQPYSWLLPKQFNQYLKESYFADFEPGIPARLSRHSIGHGVAEHADFNEKHAAIGFLILDQICFLIKRSKK